MNKYRIGTDVPFQLSVADGVEYLDLSNCTILNVAMYCDAQEAFAGSCTWELNADDHTRLDCVYPGNRQVYTGIMRAVVVMQDAAGENKAYDLADIFEIVATTDEANATEDTVTSATLSAWQLPMSTLATIVEAAINATEGATDSTISEISYTASTEDDGINVLHIEQADGTGHDFNIKNGSRGPQGRQGETGATGAQGPQGDAAGFGTIEADITGDVGTPGVSVETSGDNTSKNIMFHFTNLKGKDGDCVSAEDTGEDLPPADLYPAVQYVVQTLTAEQKQQARQNIGASDFSGDYDDLSGKPLTDNIPTPGSDNFVKSGGVYDAIHPAIQSSQPAGGMLPNVYYNLGVLTGTVVFTLASPSDNNILNHYYFTFDTGTTAPSVTFPSQITSWNGGSAPSVVASKHYEISIIGGIAAFMEV